MPGWVVAGWLADWLAGWLAGRLAGNKVMIKLAQCS